MSVSEIVSRGKVVRPTSGKGGSRNCALVETVGGNELLQSLASHAKEFGTSSKENVNLKDSLQGETDDRDTN